MRISEPVPIISAAPSDITLDYHLNNTLGRYPYSLGASQEQRSRIPNKAQAPQ